MNDDPKEPRYTRDEVEEILRRALLRPARGETTQEELLAVAREAGIPEDAVREAARELEGNRERDAVRERLRRARRASLGVHGSVYALVNFGLLLLNLATNMATVTEGVPRWWFVYPLVTWGLGLAAHAAAVRWGAGPSEAAVEAALSREHAARAAQEAQEAQEAHATRQAPGAPEVNAAPEGARVRVTQDLDALLGTRDTDALLEPGEARSTAEETPTASVTARADRRGPPGSEG
jgi:hypothetical protein